MRITADFFFGGGGGGGVGGYIMHSADSVSGL